MIKTLLAVLVALGIAIGALSATGGQLALSATSPPGTHPCTNPDGRVSSSPSAEFGFGGASAVSADVWNDINISETLSACAMNSWKESASAAESGDNGAVQQYVNSNVTLSSATALSSYTTLTSNMRVTDAPACTGNDYEFANDVWFGGSTEWSGKSTELMIWAYTCNQVPAGKDVATVTLDGHAYSVWVGDDSAGNIITFDSTSNYTSDHTDLLAFADYAQSNGDLPSADLWQVGMGAEICYTSGTQEFQQTAFNLWGNGQKIIG